MPKHQSQATIFSDNDLYAGGQDIGNLELNGGDLGAGRQREEDKSATFQISVVHRRAMAGQLP